MKEILLVDDDATLRAVVRMMLEQRGYVVTEAGDGADALDHLARRRPDVVIADLKMPVVDGSELLRRIRATAEMSSLPVILLSGNEEGARGVHAANSVLVKPFELTALITTVESTPSNDSDLQVA